MGKYILCTKILMVCFLIENARPAFPRCDGRLVCGSNGQVYETSCDFELALRLDQDLRMLPLQECLGMLYVEMPAENFWAPGNMKLALRNNQHLSAKKFADNVKIYTQKIVESVGKDKMAQAVQALKDEVNVKVKQIVNQVDQAMSVVLDDVKKSSGKAG